MNDDRRVVEVGRLPVRSGTLEFNDPQWGGESVCVSDIPPGETRFTAVIDDGDGGIVAELRVDLPGASPGDPEPGSPEEVGEVLIDSATLVAADAADFETGWTEQGAGRVGVFAVGVRMRAKIEREFGLTLRVSEYEKPHRRHAETVDPFPPETERAVREFIKAEKGADYAYIHLWVEEHGSFERALEAESVPPSIVPMGDAPEPRMIVCSTGSSDGTYPVMVQRVNGVPRWITVEFA